MQEEVKRSISRRAKSVRPDMEGRSENKMSRLDLSRILNKSFVSRCPSARSVGRIEKQNETMYDKLIKKNLVE